MMKKLSSLFKLVHLLVACLLLATKGIDAQESKDRRLGRVHSTKGENDIDPAQEFFQAFLGESDNRINSSRRRLKSDVKTSAHTYWYGGVAKHNTYWHGGVAKHKSKATKKDGKSKKSGKTKSAKAKIEKKNVYPWMGVRPGKPTTRPTRRPTRRPESTPTRKPTRKPSSVTPPTPTPNPIPSPRDRFVQITMGGLLAATNLEPIPPSGSDQMKELARIFEDTILSSLEDIYKCIVYEIGGTPVRVGGIRSVASNRRLQGQSQVRFTLKVTKPCSGCDKAEAMILGSLVFDQTFQTLDESAKSGDMTKNFCSNASGTGVITSPCQVTITSVEGSSLDVKFVEDTTTPKPTTPKPTFMPPTMPPVKWDPTPAPTLKPVTTAPTRKGATASPTDETAAPSTPTPNPTIAPITSSPVDVPTTIAPTKFIGQPTVTPTLKPTSPNETPAPSSVSPPVSIAPTSTPPGAIYYTGFETGKFPNDSYWTTSKSAPWIIDTERVQSGKFSIRSADLESEELTPRDSNVTFTTRDDFPAGTLVLNILAGTRMPFDDLQYFVDGVYRGRLQAENEGETDFKRVIIGMAPGRHEIEFTYKYNPIDLPKFPPFGDYDHIGAVYMDNVYFLPDGVTMTPTSEKTSVQPTANPQTVASTPAPSVKPTYAPTKSPSKASAPGFFDGFESGDFSGEDWSIAGQDAWFVDQTRPYQGSYSAHVKTTDIPESQLYSELNLPLSLEAPGFIQFYFFAPISQPFESLQLWVDGQFLTPLTTEGEGGEWSQAGSILSSGDHTVTWRYSRNPAGAPQEVIDSWPSPDWRLGEAWLDNVKLLGSTPSFTENWDSGDFSANPWILSGDANWVITDKEKFQGEYSATIASDDIEANSGISDLSIDLITEKGGNLKWELLPSLQSTFDLFQVIIDGIKVYESAEIQDEWQSQELNIQPGKRQVTFRLVKNPNNLDEAIISTLSKDPNHQGQVWLDAIVFTANS
mmetsp:Transcript_284/g.590  ORF Transcript_284/g.590 Transcript_284/m.590 type:complete len:977 (-) Transcript_284:75-3005(-)